MFATLLESSIVVLALWALVTQVALPVWRGTPLWPIFSDKAKIERELQDQRERAAQAHREAELRHEIENLRNEKREAEQDAASARATLRAIHLEKESE